MASSLQPLLGVASYHGTDTITDGPLVSSSRRGVSEQRRSRRAVIGLRIEFTVRDSEGMFPATARNISLGGMFIETTFLQTLGKTVLLRLIDPDLQTVVVVPATVRWMGETGMGVQFHFVGMREALAVAHIVSDVESFRD